jgi:hypothetical protein
MTTTAQRCRVISAALDSGDMTVLSTEEQFIREHRQAVWDARAAQQARCTAGQQARRTRVVVEIDDDSDDTDDSADSDSDSDGKCDPEDDPDCLPDDDDD